MSTYSNTAREVEMPNGDVVVIHNAPTGGANTTSNIKKFKYDDNGHVTESEAANATDLNLNSYSTPTTGSTAIGTSDAVQTAIGKLDHQSQIDQSNILSVANRTGKNRLPFFGLDTVKSLNTAGSWSNNAYTYKNVTFTVNADGTISVSGTLASGETSAIFWLFGVNQKVLFKDLGAGNILNGCPSGGGNQTYGLMLEMAELPYSGVAYDFSNHPAITPAAATKDGSTIGCYIVVSTHSAVNLVFKPMVNEPDMYALDTSYVPYALPNYDLTRLEAEDRAALAEEIDAGAKNKFNLAGATITTGNASYTISGNAITVTSSGTWAVAYTPITLPAGDYVLDLDVTTRTSTTTNPKITIYTSTQLMDYVGSLDIKATGHYTLSFRSTGSTLYLAWYANQSGTSSSTNTLTVTNMMVATKAAFGVSNKFVPYRPNYDLVCGNALGYTITQTSTSFSNVLANAMEPYYFKNDYDTHTGMLFISTDVTNEYCVAYFSIDRGQSITIVKLSNNVIDLSAYNDAGSIVLSGGTAPYTMTVKYNN